MADHVVMVEHTVVAECETLVAWNAVGLAENQSLCTSLDRIAALAGVDNSRCCGRNGESDSVELHGCLDWGRFDGCRGKYLQFRNVKNEYTRTSQTNENGAKTNSRE